MSALFRNLAAITLMCFCGCNADRDDSRQSESTGAANSQGNVIPSNSVNDNQTAIDIEPGFYRDGAELERISALLAESDASILLDYHSGIEWYDRSDKTRESLGNINDVRERLAVIENKQLVTVSTGKAAWDQYDEHIASISEFAEELGFEVTVVIDHSAQGLMISKVIRHGE